MHGSKQKIGAAAICNASTATLRPGRTKPAILVLVHEATRTEAPILAWNLILHLRKKFDVVTILKGRGPLETSLEAASTKILALPDGSSDDNGELLRQLQEIVTAYSPRYAIASGVATNELAAILVDLDVPVVALVQEFASDFPPASHSLYRKASKIVFPANIVAAAAEADSFTLGRRGYEIITPGQTLYPDSNAKHASSAALRSVVSSISKDTFLVAGAGSITYRGGVDTFIAIAADLFRRNASINFRFVWAARTSEVDASYKSSLDEQIVKSGLEDRVILIDGASDLGPLYRRADVFVLSSRRDHLPDVSIDAAVRGIPLVCFENASGMAEFLTEKQSTRSLVVPYQDAAGAARTINRLFKDRKYRTKISLALKKRAKAAFRIERYVGSLQKLGQNCFDDRKQDVRDLDLILKSGVFDAKLCFGDQHGGHSVPDLIARFLREWRIVMPSYPPGCDTFFRRPAVGFNPLIYASDRREYRFSNQNPLAHFLRSGRPEGRWLHEVIVPPKQAPDKLPSQIRAALHGHFHFPDLLPEFLQRLHCNRMKIDLFLTTTSRKKAAEIKKTVSDFGLNNVDISVAANLGRDIGPFLKNLHHFARNHDVIGHLHGKKSPHLAPAKGERWRDFAMQHLLGGTHPMADIILQRFADDPELGLVFPEDPILTGWDKNREIAEKLAKRMRIAAPLPAYFDFPVGTMFWARPRALKPMFDLRLSDKDYPAEPAQIDGTILHALERLLPFSALKAGYRYETTHVAGCWR